MYALDTNSVVYFFKGMGRVTERLLSTPPREIALPAVVLYELELGIATAEAEEVTLGLLEKMATYLQRARRNPELRFTDAAPEEV